MFKGTDPDVNLHVFTAGCEEIDRMLRFRDRLRSSPEDRDLYLARKRELATRTWRYDAGLRGREERGGGGDPGAGGRLSLSPATAASTR